MQEAIRHERPHSSPKLSAIPQQHQYTVFIRLPFPRGDFVDPPLVQWDATKDKALWKIISKSSNSGDLNWQDIASRFEVSLDFLMQHAAWLYERHFAGMKKQMQRLASTASPLPTAARPRTSSNANDGSAAVGLSRTASRSSREARPGSAVSTQVPETDGTGTPRPGFPRIPSSATITQSKLFTSAQTVAQKTAQEQRLPYRSPPSPVLSQSVDSQASDTASYKSAQAQPFRRSPLPKKPVLGALSSDDDQESGDIDDGEQSSSGGDLPFAAATKQSVSPAATRSEQKRPVARAFPSSSSSVASTIPTQSTDPGSRPSQKRPDALSPKHRAQLTQLSPKGKGDGSDGTPSMGSSFSDLDDAGISASAIEEAAMQAGGISIASRVSGLSQAFRGNR